MKLSVKRTDYTTTSTIGELSLDGTFFGYTLEDVVRPSGAAKVAGQTAIPAGTYTVIINKSNRFGCMMPLLLDVPGYAGIRLHAGSYATHSEGCLLIGGKKGKDIITESKVTYQKLFTKLWDCHERGEKMVLTITDTQSSPLAAKTPAKKAK